MHLQETIENTQQSLRAHGFSPSTKKWKNVRLIVHPTRPRGDMLLEGTIHWSAEMRLTLSVNGFFFRFDPLDGFVPTTAGETIRRAFSPTLQTARKFLDVALDEKQLKLSSTRSYNIRFVVWKDQPEMLEFYDWKEIRSNRKRRRSEA